MIKLYTSLNYFKTNEIIIDNESFFQNINTNELSGEFLELMQIIDKATLLNAKTGKIETPYGICNITDLSTGCKTALNIMYKHKYNKFPTVRAVNITECGANALEIIFETIEKYDIDINLVLKHDDRLCECKERDYLINNEHHINQLVFIGAYR